MSKEKVIRVALRVVNNNDGTFSFQYCKDQWMTLPFIWPSEASAKRDFTMIVQTMEKRGYTVIPSDEQEVEKAM
jgi:hypothetical protein